MEVLTLEDLDHMGGFTGLHTAVEGVTWAIVVGVGVGVASQFFKCAMRSFLPYPPSPPTGLVH